MAITILDQNDKQELEGKIEQLSEEIADKGNPTNEQISAAVSVYMSENPVQLEYVTPEMFGAVGDGSANDDTAIQTALNHGGLVIFPGTQYKIGTNITIPSNTYILGFGARITPYNWKGKFITSSTEGSKNIHVNGLAFDGYLTTMYNRDAAHGLQLNGVTNCTVENCTFNDNNDGIYISYNANQRNEVKIRNCVFTNFMRQGITLIHGEAVIEYCTFTRNEEKGINAIDLEPNNTYEIPKAVVRNCVFTNCSIYANRKDTVENREHIDLEITVENCNITSGSAIGCVDVSFAKKAHIKNCILSDVADRHDNIYSSAVMFYRVTDASVENCVITSTSASAISGADSYLYISDCDIAPDHYGIVSIGYRCDVLNSRVKSSGDWSLIFQTQVREGIVSGCDFGNGVTIGEGSNAEIGYPANVRFAFNTIKAPEENAKECGLLISADNSIFVYNRITGFATSIADGSAYVGTGNIVEPNAIDVVDEQAV